MLGRRAGYDRIHFVTKEEIKSLYILEGKASEEADVLAEDVYREINSLNDKDLHLWRRIRNFEFTNYL